MDMRRGMGAGLCAGAVMLLGACATQRLDQFSTFAEAGDAYGRAMTGLVDEAAGAAIDADSAALILGRAAWDPAERRRRYLQHTRVLTGYLDALAALRRQAHLLQSYFAALARLARSDAPAGIAQEAEAVFQRLQALHPRLQDARIKDTPVKKLIRPAVTLAVAQFQHAALERELRRRAPALERALELQRAALALVAGGLAADLEFLHQQRRFTEVAAVYAGGRRLPAKWRRTRRELLQARLLSASAQEAARAAETLKTTFTALVENKVRPQDFERLFADIHALLDLVERLAAGAPRKAG